MHLQSNQTKTLWKKAQPIANYTSMKGETNFIWVLLKHLFHNITWFWLRNLVRAREMQTLSAYQSWPKELYKKKV